MSNAKILIVEDEKIVAKDIHNQLRRFGYEVTAIVSTGEEAIQKAIETKPDLALLDIRLHGETDGVMVAEQIRERLGIPVVYLTAYADEETLRRAKLTEPFGYLVKPFGERELHSTIEIALHRHAMERRLQESEEWLRTTLMSIGDGVIAVDVGERVRSINHVAAELTGWPEEEAVGRPVSEVFNIINEDRTPVEDMPVTKAIREGVFTGNIKFILITKTGLEIPVEDGAAPIRDEKGQITGAVVVFRDIREQRRHEEERERSLAREQAMRAEAERLLRFKDEFLATLSHELRTPLNMISGWTQHLQRGNLDADGAALALESIRRNIHAQTQIIDDLLDVSAIIMGKLRLSMQIVDADDRLREALQAARPAAEAKGIELEYLPDPGAVFVLADPARLQQIAWNLLSNAVKFADRGGRVKLRLRRDGGQIVISVSDTGCGIAPEFLPHVFDRFSQADGSTVPDARRSRIGPGHSTHLDPTHESILTELLAKATRMPVIEVQDGDAVAPDHVYVIPRNTRMAIEGGVLRLRPRQEGRGPHRPIDSFLQSLAEDRSARAIGVILSGTATDGTLGLEAIKSEGGITFAQDPKSAKFDSMPRSAIAAGCVDLILNPEEIAEELARISRHPYVVPATVAKPDVEETEQPAGKNGLNKILTLLRRTTGVDFSLYKTNTLQRRVRRRMILNKMDGLEEYAQYLRENAAEVENLYQDILINVTSFFRDPEAFEILKEKIFPRLIERRTPDEPVRIWVMGCSTGEEAYSIAMVFTEFSSERSGHIPVQIFATDINEKSIEKARAGLYSKDITADVSPERLRRFFTEAGGGYRVSKPLRDMCVFARQNVAADPPFSRIDMISCRNLLIYLESALQKQILPLLHYALKPTGILWLGSSETAGAAPDLFEPEDKRHRFYAKIPVTKLPRLSYLTAAEARKKDSAPSADEIVGPTAASGGKEARREADRIILARYAPASALINEDLNVLQLRGDTTPYLEQSHGKAAGNLVKLAREDLLIALLAAINKARKDESPVRKENLRVRHDGETRNVNLEVIPLKHPISRERHFLALFETAETSDQGRGREAGGARRKSEAQRIRQLEQELAAARDYLQSVIEEYEATNEELQSAGEEVQSSNEELQSVNEELETSKEELESSNEELTTLNEELNNRNTELGRLNSDLANLLGSVQIPILMLDG
jgi:two-component system, chemotaxis family, CheB/CheR fusion protein